MVISDVKFQELLDEFADAVKKNYYHKMAYPIWRELRTTLNIPSVCINEDNVGRWEIMRGGESYWFSKVDEGFGSFIDVHSAALGLFCDEGNSVVAQELATKSVNVNGPMITVDDGIATWNYPPDYISNYASSIPKNITFNPQPATINKDNNKENDTMKNMLNFDFGPCDEANVRMSMYGIAIKNASGNFVSYDTANDSIMDVDVFNFDGRKFLFKMPVAIKDVKVGDTVIHSRKPMFVVEVNTKSLKVVDPVDGEKKEIMLTRSPFGFDFATKVVNLFAGIAGSNQPASPDNPFGNMWMLMLLGNEDEALDKNLVPFLLMNNGTANMNPMMMYMLMNKNGSSNALLPLMMMMNGNAQAAAANN